MRKWLPRAYGTHHNTASTARDDKNPTREFRRINPGPILLKQPYYLCNRQYFGVQKAKNGDRGTIIVYSAALILHNGYAFRGLLDGELKTPKELNKLSWLLVSPK